MKYNLSKIMKRAWEIKRKVKNTFAQALKMAWKIAKFEIEILEKWAREETGKVSFNIWSSYGLVRAYYKCSWFSNYQNNYKKTNYINLLED